MRADRRARRAAASPGTVGASTARLPLRLLQRTSLHHHLLHHVSRQAPALHSCRSICCTAAPPDMTGGCTARLSLRRLRRHIM